LTEAVDIFSELFNTKLELTDSALLVILDLIKKPKNKHNFYNRETQPSKYKKKSGTKCDHSIGVTGDQIIGVRHRQAGIH